MQNIKPYYSNLIILLVLLFLIIKFLDEQKKYQDQGQREEKEDRLDSFFKEIKIEEKPRVDRILNIDINSIDNSAAKDIFYRSLSFPLQGICRTLKRLGGNFIAGPHLQVDGDKFICMDNIAEKDSCIIYSFGINDDWTFEDLIDKIGCHTFAYDHTINAPPNRGNNIKYFKTGLGIGPSLKTLKELMIDNNHENSTIDYLKIDIEGGEFATGGFNNWIESQVLKNVDQIALELHMNREQDPRQYIEALKILQDLYKIGFREVSHEVNMVAGPGGDMFYHFFEVVFLKVRNN